MPFNLDKFVTSPSVEELDSLKKSEIVKVAKHYGIEFQPLMRKDEIKRYVLEYLVDEGVLPLVQYWKQLSLCQLTTHLN
ncbi:hypothetical protein HOLleu_35430 [Holothuria leucospilota]|uniref:Uncharacterized protein n=1 Tax=Holothuria leucospilota TaxID=206669 RepID=A0A9Q0YMM8_HOLLE|nr:hypothetical protein HOLleu_35430 [Holothuria leucospilota]